MKKKINRNIIKTILLLFLFIILFTGFTSATLVKPSCNIDDYWKYNVNISHNDNFKDIATAYIIKIKNQTIVDVENISYDVWEITSNAPWTGFDYYNITSYYHISDLAKIKEIIDLENNINSSNNGEDNSSIFENSLYTMSSYIGLIATSYYTEHNEYIFKENQPEIQYPVKIGDTWTFDNNHILLKKTSNQENIAIPHYFGGEYTYKCLGKTIFATDIGDYECYIIEKKYTTESASPRPEEKIKISDVTVYYYSNEIGNFIKSTNRIIIEYISSGEVNNELPTTTTYTNSLSSYKCNNTVYSFQYISEKNTEIDTEIPHIQLFIGLLFVIFIAIVIFMYIRKKRN